MGKITLTVDDEILTAVRRLAVERGSTVNEMVRDYLTNLAKYQGRARDARARLRQLSMQSTGQLGEKRWTRAELHGN